jgi:hypothetical protein
MMHLKKLSITQDENWIKKFKLLMHQLKVAILEGDGGGERVATSLAQFALIEDGAGA